VSIFQIRYSAGTVSVGRPLRRAANDGPEWQPFSFPTAASPHVLRHRTISSLWNFYLVLFCRRQDVSYQNLHRAADVRDVFEKAIALTR
jgi:hypothetical protein